MLDADADFSWIEADMKKLIFAVSAGAVATMFLATGCMETVSGTHTFASTIGKDTMSGRYQRTIDQVYQASIAVIQQNGVIVTEFIPHDTTNAVRSLEGRVNERNVWIRVEAVDPRVTALDVETRTKWGSRDLDLSHELEKEIALQLAR